MLTEITQDEAYYWMYSRYSAWGYFDHPPMIALWIKAGNVLFEKELGTRIMIILAQIITLSLIWLMIGEKETGTRKILLYFGICASIVMFQAYGFIATPDAPLLFFTALFLVGYQRFLESENRINSLWLAVSMAGLVYSKYHGILIILFVMVSNLRLLRNLYFWQAGLLAILLFAPHILWQIQNDFPSLRYHLVSRSRPFNIKHILNYFPNQLFSFNPFFLVLTLWVMIRSGPRDLFERALYFISWGFLAFFLITTVRGHVEPHWTIAAAVSMIILVYRRVATSSNLWTYTKWILFPSILFLLVIRVELIWDILPVRLKFHGDRDWSKHIAALAGDTPVIFRNSYQRPSIYTFHTGKPATTLNSIYYRKNQYDYWPFEESFFGKEAILMTNVNDPLAERILLPNGRTEYLHKTSAFFAVQKLKIQYDLFPMSVLKVGDTITLNIVLFNPYPYRIPLQDPVFPVIYNTTFIKSGNDMTITPGKVTPALAEIKPGESIRMKFTFEVPDICPRIYTFGIVLQAGIIQEAYNSAFIPVRVE